MANKIILKKSAVSGKVPLPTDLVYGEVALNYNDGRMYYRKNDDTIGQIGGSGGGSGNLYVEARNSNFIPVSFYSGNLSVLSRSGTVEVPA
jgi:hypothetical protein